MKVDKQAVVFSTLHEGGQISENPMSDSTKFLTHDIIEHNQLRDNPVGATALMNGIDVVGIAPGQTCDTTAVSLQDIMEHSGQDVHAPLLFMETLMGDDLVDDDGDDGDDGNENDPDTGHGRA